MEFRIELHAALYETGQGAPIYDADFSPRKMGQFRITRGR